ncbi:cytochrome d ubiquinol oxidase subunit II [Rothia nasimurium]|uniref:Cytochrome d ubiquinol oxidase subunit II n=1 Tax=Rothia nasimurium TaxID=85336 RepID=A0A4Y9F275_9MICC|nr:cytochrome d ubiquinol oxidase subunit II [Rothia nasimurium]MBF0808969.1 cytochrome d ubiquinol oxidase subunit II [Rothia nasimurium]TFU20983.1 cytochrome d ubiquinol oxidase subunit II [Rothia nasimurium]
MFELFADQPLLPTLWFAVISFFWAGYIILDGFDLGVGMLMSRIFAKNEKERRLLLNTIGPVWDGNEVWVVTGGAATFAAFPLWYASLFSALYIPLTLALLALIFRAVAIEYRGKKDSESWIAGWTLAISLGSFFIAFLVGALLALTSTGLPINANGDRVGGAFAWLTPAVFMGGLAMVGISLVMGLAFIALKTDGEVRHRAGAALVKFSPLLVLPVIVWVIYMQVTTGNGISYALTVLAVLALAAAWFFASRRSEGKAFSGFAVFVGFGVLAIFLALYPNVLPSTLDEAYNLTIANASSSEYTLRVMSWVGLFGIPILLVYQSWTYWVFRKRLRVENIPDAHDATELATRATRASVHNA